MGALGVTPEFEVALLKVMHDFKIGSNANDSEMVAVGIAPEDCERLLTISLESALGDGKDDELAAIVVAVQWAAAVGVQIERARWEQHAA